MKLKINDDTLIILVYILSCGMIVGQLMGIQMITSLSFALSFVVVSLIWAVHLDKMNVLDFLSVAIIFLSLLSAFITCRNFSVGYFYKWLMFSAVFMCFSSCLKIKIQETTIKALFGINFILSISCVLAYIIRFDEAFYITNTGVRYLKFDFYNPNSLALFLVGIVSTGMLYCAIYQVKLWKRICYISIFLFLIIKTLSRTSLIAVLFFVAISVIFMRKKYYYLPKNGVFNLIISVFPLLFAMVYLSLIGNVNQNGFLSVLISEGKELDSRQYVWKYAFELFEKSPVMGSYGYVTTTSEFSQMHNSHVDVLASYGIVVFVLVVLFLFIVLKESIRKSRETKRSLSVWAFIMCLMLGSGEAILFSGGLSFYLMVGQFLLFSNASAGNWESWNREVYNEKQDC